jgi:hypothetical protein
MKLAEVTAQLGAFGFAADEVARRRGAGPSAVNAWTALQTELLLRYEALPPEQQAALAASYQQLQALQLTSVKRAGSLPERTAMVAGQPYPLPGLPGLALRQDQHTYGPWLGELISHLSPEDQARALRSCQLGFALGTGGRHLAIDMASLQQTLRTITVTPRCFECRGEADWIMLYRCQRCDWESQPACPRCDELPGAPADLTAGLHALHNHLRGRHGITA